jgi:2-methylaconitate isomerase
MLSGEIIDAGQVDLTVRFISDSRPHRALPLTSALCTAVAARIMGTVPAQASTAVPAASIRIGIP